MAMPLPSRAPTLAMLDLFVSVVDLGSITRTAAAHGVSQPTVSTAMARLERRVGVPLLRRTHAGCEPTDAGRLVGEWARSVIDAAARLDDALTTLRADRATSLSLAASYTIAEYLLPTWLTAFRQAWPGVAVQLAVVNSAEVTARILGERADLGFVEGAKVNRELSSQVVGTDELAIVVRPDHPWGRRRRPVTVMELAEARLVVREPGSGTREVLEDFLRSHRSEPPQPLLELGSTTAVKGAVLDGAGPAVLSRLAVSAEIDNGRLQTVAVRGIKLDRTLRAVWPAGHRLTGQAAGLVACALAS